LTVYSEDDRPAYCLPLRSTDWRHTALSKCILIDWVIICVIMYPSRRSRKRLMIRKSIRQSIQFCASLTQQK